MSDFFDPMNCSPPVSSVHGDSPGKNTEWVSMPCSRESSQPRDWTQVSRIVGGFFTVWATREAQEYWNGYPIPFLGELPGPGIELGSPALHADSLPAALPGKLHFMCILPQLKWKKKFCLMYLEDDLMRTSRMERDQLENSANQGRDNGDFNSGSLSRVEVKGRDGEIIRR